MKTKLMVGGLMVLGLIGCSDRNRFEVLQQSSDRMTVLFDRSTGDILKIAQSGYIENVGPFGGSVETGKRK
jgi:hypothetical protein